MMIVTSSGVLKPVGELKALRSRVSISVVGRSSGSLVARTAARRGWFGQVAEQPLRGAQRGDLVGDGEVGDAARAVHLRAAEVVGGHVLAEHALDHARAGQAEERVGGLDHEAALARQVGAAAGVVAEHAHDARHDAADLAQRGERLGIAVEAADAGRHEGAGAVVHADQRDAALAGEVDEVGQLAAVGRVHRAGADREVVAVERDVAAADLEDRR